MDFNNKQKLEIAGFIDKMFDDGYGKSKHTAAQFLRMNLPLELEVDKWYKGINDHIVFVTGNAPIDDWVHCYGFDCDGDWFDEYNESNRRSQTDPKHLHTLATKEEVKKALIKEAKKRGFKLGLKTTPVYKTTEEYWVIDGLADGIHEYYPRDIENTEGGDIFYFNGTAIYLQGKWAKIINDPCDSLKENAEKITETLKDLECQLKKIKKEIKSLKLA